MRLGRGSPAPGGGGTSEYSQALGAPAGVTTGAVQCLEPPGFLSQRRYQISVSSLFPHSCVCTCSPAGPGDLPVCPTAWARLLWTKVLSLDPDSTISKAAP